MLFGMHLDSNRIPVCRINTNGGIMIGKTETLHSKSDPIVVYSRSNKYVFFTNIRSESELGPPLRIGGPLSKV